jgi:hypothetical protein
LGNDLLIVIPDLESPDAGNEKFGTVEPITVYRG